MIIAIVFSVIFGFSLYVYLFAVSSLKLKIEYHAIQNRLPITFFMILIASILIGGYMQFNISEIFGDEVIVNSVRITGLNLITYTFLSMLVFTLSCYGFSILWRKYEVSKEKVIYDEKNAMIKKSLMKMLDSQKGIDSHSDNLDGKNLSALMLIFSDLMLEINKLSKSNSKENRYDILDDYVDCLRHILSETNLIKHKDIDISTSISKDVNYSIIELQNAIVYAEQKYNHKQSKNTHKSSFNKFNYTKNIQHILNEYVHLGNLIGFSWQDIENAYYSKNKKKY